MYPDQVRILAVDDFTWPAESLAPLARKMGLMPPKITELTLGYSIMIRSGVFGSADLPRVLSHELSHAHQYGVMGSLSAFSDAYLSLIIAVGYDDAPLEMDATRHERYLISAAPLIVWNTVG